MSSGGWESLTNELARGIAALADGDTIILRNDVYFTQMQQGPSWLTIEAVSNEFLPLQRQIGTEQQQRLAQMGWEPPQPPGRLNWWKTYSWPLPSSEARQAASLLTSTLRDVFGAYEVGTITKERFNAFKE